MGLPPPFRCVFTSLTNPTFPTRDLVVTEVPLGMHHLGINPITITINRITDYNPIGHPISDGIEHHDIGNRSHHQTKGIFFRTLLKPICVGCHRPDISNRRSFRDGGTTWYASPRAVKMISTFYH